MPIASLSPTELGSAFYRRVTQRDTADMTPDAALTSATVAFTFLDAAADLEGKSKKHGHL